MAHTQVEACKIELEAELAELVEKQATLDPRDYARRHMALSATSRACQAMLTEYEEEVMERPADEVPEPPPPAEEPPPPAEEPTEPSQ